MNTSIRFVRYLAVATAIAGVVMCDANAAPTLEQVQQLMKRRAIPVWQNAAAQIKRLRDNPPDAYATETWKALDAETDVTTGKAPLARATMPKDGKDLFVIATWLRWRILSENADPRYSYAYATDLHYMRDNNGGFQKDAAIFFFQAKLALAIDGARCVDRASPDSIALGYETQKYVQPLIEQIGKMSKNEKAVAMLEAAAIEEMRGERPLLGAICTRGARTMLKAMASGRQPVQVSPSDPRASQSLGNTYSIDVSGLEPEVLSEDQWRAKRREILNSYIKSAAESL